MYSGCPTFCRIFQIHSIHFVHYYPICPKFKTSIFIKIGQSVKLLKTDQFSDPMSAKSIFFLMRFTKTSISRKWLNIFQFRKNHSTGNKITFPKIYNIIWLFFVNIVIFDDNVKISFKTCLNFSFKGL